MVVLPPSGVPTEIRTYSDELKVTGEDKPVSYVGVGISTDSQNDFSLFTGPKDVDILRQVNPKLSLLIKWGFFGILAKPLFLWLNWTYDHWTFNYGWAIVVMTIIINLALFPLRISSLKSARKMQKIQPLVKSINEKYKNIKINDPRKAEQNQEVMALYKREGINPLGGCLPMLIQLPFLYAFYQVLSISIELRHAPWLWLNDLSAPRAVSDSLPGRGPDRDAISDTAHDAHGRSGSVAAENDGVYAADVWRVFLVFTVRASSILSDQQLGGNWSAATNKQDDAHAACPGCFRSGCRECRKRSGDWQRAGQEDGEEVNEVYGRLAEAEAGRVSASRAGANRVRAEL